MTERIKVGVIGCRVGRTWVAGAQAGAATTAWAVADLNQDLARKTAAEHKMNWPCWFDGSNALEREHFHVDGSWVKTCSKWLL